MKLGEKAEATPEVVVTRDLFGSEAYQLVTDELTEADELTAEGEFPQYGQFLEVDSRAYPHGDERGEKYIEVPTALARWVVDNVEEGDWFRITETRKVDGEWQVDGEALEDPPWSA
jgi:hypothetical protein